MKKYERYNVNVKNTVSEEQYKDCWKQYSGLIRQICSHKANNACQFEDFLALARGDLLEILENYNPNLSNMSTFIWMCLNNKLNTVKKNEKVYADRLAAMTGNFKSHVIEENPYHQILIEELLSILENKKREILINYYLKSMTFEEIANLMKMTTGSVHRLRNEALEQIRQQFNIDLSGDKN